jgi:exopolysaccharide biosynthesis polyprenyl glycosylphosphotransferase
VVGLILYTFLVRADEYDISRWWLVMVWFFSIATVGTSRFLYRRVIFRLRERGFFTRRVLIVGANEEGQQVATQLQNSPRAGIEVVGFVDPQATLGTQAGGFPVLGDLASIGSLIGRMEAEELIVIPTALDREALLGIYRDWGKDGVRIRLSSGLYELFTTGVRVKEEGFVPLFTLNRTRITGVDAVVKTVMDYAIASTAIVLLSPILLIISILIKRSSPGPVIYRRRVVGLYGRVFDAFKFRTMVPDAEAHLQASPELQKEWEETGKIQNDPRITTVGRVLRRFSLDELPQLFNVLRGEMSLVGPRMITPAELHHFGRWRYNLLTVKPGLAGLWQVSGRSDLSYEERVRLDMHYIRNHTMWLDLQLMVATVTAVLAGRGAY